MIAQTLQIWGYHFFLLLYFNKIVITFQVIYITNSFNTPRIKYRECFILGWG
mgnify:CR=1 FL=1